jgi:hypothetical protein
MIKDALSLPDTHKGYLESSKFQVGDVVFAKGVNSAINKIVKADNKHNRGVDPSATQRPAMVHGVIVGFNKSRTKFIIRIENLLDVNMIEGKTDALIAGKEIEASVEKCCVTGFFEGFTHRSYMWIKKD